MAETTLVYTPRFAEYDFGPGHPMRPLRVQRTYELIRACGLLERPHVSLVAPSMVDEETLALVHHRKYIGAVRTPRQGEYAHRALDFGLGTIDNPIVEGMYEASAIVVGGSVSAADGVIDGAASVAFNPSGGLHHARRARAAGFCIFNDAAVAIAHLLKRCGKDVKVAYVDIDAHHGDGVQHAFYTTSDVLTVSVHQTGYTIFPGTGFVEEIGQGPGRGTSVNVPLRPGAGDEAYERVFDAVVLPVLRAYKPDVLVTQLGADAVVGDVVANLRMSLRQFERNVCAFRELDVPWLALGGGGYDVSNVVRAWTLAWSVIAETDLPDEIPSEWLALAALHGVAISKLRGNIERTPTDEAVLEDLDRTIAALRRSVFPILGVTE